MQSNLPMQSVTNYQIKLDIYLFMVIWIVEFRLQIIDVFARADLWQVVWAWGTKWGLSGGDQLPAKQINISTHALCTLHTEGCPHTTAECCHCLQH